MIVLIKEDNVIILKSLRVFAGTGEPQKADMTLEVYGEIKKQLRLEMAQWMLFLNV